MVGYRENVVRLGFNNLICLKCGGRVRFRKESLWHTHPITTTLHCNILYGISIINGCVSQQDRSSLRRRSENDSFPLVTHNP